MYGFLVIPRSHGATSSRVDSKRRRLFSSRDDKHRPLSAQRHDYYVAGTDCSISKFSYALAVNRDCTGLRFLPHSRLAVPARIGKEDERKTLGGEKERKAIIPFSPPSLLHFLPHCKTPLWPWVHLLRELLLPLELPLPELDTLSDLLMDFFVGSSNSLSNIWRMVLCLRLNGFVYMFDFSSGREGGLYFRSTHEESSSSDIYRARYISLQYSSGLKFFSIDRSVPR